MSIFQKCADWIQSLKTPLWLKEMLGDLQDLILSIILSIGKEYLRQIQAKIWEVNEMAIPSEQKFKIVFSFTKSLVPEMKDSVANALINLLVLKIKNISI